MRLRVEKVFNLSNRCNGSQGLALRVMSPSAVITSASRPPGPAFLIWQTTVLLKSSREVQNLRLQLSAMQCQPGLCLGGMLSQDSI